MADEIMYVEEVDSSSMQLMQMDLAMLDKQIATAKRFPRDIKKCTREAISMATIDKETAESCTYALPRGGKKLTGESIELAKILVQEMGNMRYESEVLDADATHVTARATCMDLEKNIAFRFTCKRSIVGNSGRYNNDMITTTGMAAASIALRNAILSVIPAAITRKVYNAVKDEIAGDTSDADKLSKRVTAEIKYFTDTFAAQKLTEVELLKYIGKESVEFITREDIVALKALRESFKRGEVKFDEIFRPVEIRKPSEPVADKSSERLMKLIESAITKEGLEKYKQHITTNEQRMAYDKKFKELQ